ncbi:MAG: hypothetical protein K9N09_11385 [Candidatus Cloacimonetes bacterium]|nr:hypothetical protein [Candidatus Cloacimonadota bacterium]MCF7813545.1 hypothetical protein [Candidatus Cloacimonadota bacterium]MCF7869286.1 hypothetical protein [Candidatus Cloacimonadota bacterium]MCF7884199.1 hypothetical protein [Candidatus Cloacimonadota bacterium]
MNPKVDKFLEDHNMTYLFLLMANLEVARLSNLPFTVKKQLKGKLTNIALEHVAENNIPDYVMKEAMEQLDEELAEK